MCHACGGFCSHVQYHKDYANVKISFGKDRCGNPPRGLGKFHMNWANAINRLNEGADPNTAKRETAGQSPPPRVESDSNHVRMEMTPEPNESHSNESQVHLAQPQDPAHSGPQGETDKRTASGEHTR